MKEVDSLTEKLVLDSGGDPFVAHSKIEVSRPWDQKPGVQGPPRLTVTAIWDTGASHTAFSRTLIQKLDLICTGGEDHHYHSAEGLQSTKFYGANIYLTRKLHYPIWQVMEVVKVHDGEVLIGMDIIGKGDFVISNYPQEPIFSFRRPSQKRISFNA